MAVLTNREAAPGFRLAGVEVAEADSPDLARRLLINMLADNRLAVIGLDENLADCLDEPLQAKIDRLFRPVVVILPSTEGVVAKETKRVYLERLIKNAIGFEMKLG